MLEPDGGNLYRPHVFMIHSGRFWRCMHGYTWFGRDGWKGCWRCAIKNPFQWLSWRNHRSHP